LQTKPVGYIIGQQLNQTPYRLNIMISNVTCLNIYLCLQSWHMSCHQEQSATQNNTQTASVIQL